MIGEQRLSVQHRPAILEDPRARVQQLAIPAAGKNAHDGDVRCAGEQQAHIHAAASRVHERREQRRRGDEVGVGNPEPLRHRRREKLHRAINARLSREAFHYSHGGGTAFLRRGSGLVLGERAAGPRPHADECRFQRSHRRPAYRQHRVAPWRSPGREVAGPFVADAEAADHRLFAVHDEQLAVIAAERGDRTARPDRAKRTDLHTGTPQLAPVGTPAAVASEGIVEDTHAHAGARPLRPRRSEAPPGGVVADDVILEVNGPLCVGDHLEHRVERIAADRDVADEVAGNRPCTRRPIQRVRKRVHPPRPNEGSTGRSA